MTQRRDLNQRKKLRTRPTPLQRVESWFKDSGWKPFPFQRETWRAHARGGSGLVHSATGTGKTLAVWLAPLLSWMRENPVWDSSGVKSKSTGVDPQVLWITPLRALAGDTEAALRKPIDAFKIPWSLERRTGDSSTRVKQRLRRKLPSALITTPESLSLILTYEHLQRQLASLQTVVVDEWHELLGTKRGTQVELALARLRKLNPKLQTWGVSATLGNLEDALESLLGVSHGANAHIIRGYQRKKTKIGTIVPPEIERFPWAGHIGTKMVPEVSKQLGEIQSALVFANTRAQTELWYQRMLAQNPHWAGELALHHGSLDTGVRHWVEQALREEKLKAVVCTSSLDLGVDFTAVDIVVQIGSPKGAARLLQRAGRSGHQPDSTSHLAFVPTHALELVEIAAARDAIRLGELEEKPLLQKPLDVLIQHAVTLAVGGGFRRDELLEEVRTSRAYENLTDQEWDWVLEFVTRGGASLEAYPEFHRVQKFADQFVVVEKQIAITHRMNIGTIASDASMQVKYLKGRSLGSVEETFLSRLKPGEKFLFAGRVVELIRIRDNTAFVRRSKGNPDTVPRWMGGRLPLSSELSFAMRRRLDAAARGEFVGSEMSSLKPLLALQAKWSRIPRQGELLIERVQTREGHQLFIYPFAGRLAHEGLAAVLALRLSRLQPISFSMACNDYGIVMRSSEEVDLDQGLKSGLFSPDALESDILAGLNATEMCRRQFRQIARVAGLVRQGFPNQPKSAKQVQASSNLLFDVFQEFDPNNLLLAQSQREVLQHQLDSQRMHRVLEEVEGNALYVEHPPKVTPLGFPLLVDQLRDRLSSETLESRVKKLQAQLEKAALS